MLISDQVSGRVVLSLFYGMIPMAAVLLKIETKYIRSFSKSYLNEISITSEAQEQMRDQRITLVEVNQALKSGRVVYSEKENADGCVWVVEGVTCDDEYISLTLEVFCDRYHMSIISILKITREP
jgi:ATP-dependent 26S proteasome regulatory subunit